MSKESQNRLMSREELLGKGKISSLVRKFAVPSIIAMLVSAIYNIVDQIFIGHYVGPLGNAATNISFPLCMSCTAIGLLFGIGAAANFNLHLGRKEYEKAPYFVGNAVVMMICLGILLSVITEVFAKPLMIFFGSPDDVLPFALDYVKVCALGFPFLILTCGGGHILRADSSPNMSMICSMSGAIINVFLDALFVIVLGWGMKGAAYATIIGQIFSACLVLNYLRHFKTLPLTKKHFKPTLAIVGQTASLCVASCVNQFAMMAMQIILNNSLKYYGARSIYGEAIPIACAGIATKVNQVFFSIVIGFAQGSQPIESYNYGAKNYDRVKKTYMLTIKLASVASVIAFALFQLFPDKILSIFGSGSSEYVEFGVLFFRTFLFFTWLNCIQPATSQFFASVGKPLRGMFISLTRQILFLIPLILILPRFFEIKGILYAGPVSDVLAATTAAIMVYLEFKDMTRLEKEKREVQA